MDMNRPVKVNRRDAKNPIWPVMAMILFALAVSLAIAWTWQALSDDGDKLSSTDSSLNEARILVPASSPAPSPTPRPTPTPEPAPLVLPGAVPESEPVTSAYFDDAVFVGDSITTGIELYKMMANTHVLAGTGINLGTLYTAQVVKQEDGTRIPIIEGLKQQQYKKVYVMLGGNEVRDEAKDVFIKRYGKVLDDIKQLQPEALLYVQSILPVTKNNKYRMDNPRIDEFNAALLALCEEKGVYYLNVAESMKDESGMLPDAASPADGMHFGPEYYNKWFEYLKCHIVTS